MTVQELTFTCSMGVFTFDRNVKLSHAKLLRDTVTGRWCNPPTGQKKLRNELDIYDFVDTLPPLLSNIDFEIAVRRPR